MFHVTRCSDGSAYAPKVRRTNQNECSGRRKRGRLPRPQLAKPSPNHPFPCGGLTLLAASFAGCGVRQSPSGGLGPFFEGRQQRWRLAADLRCEPTRRPRRLEKLASPSLVAGVCRLVGRRLIASGLALILSGPLFAALSLLVTLPHRPSLLAAVRPKRQTARDRRDPGRSCVFFTGEGGPGDYVPNRPSPLGDA